ncbi:MAG: 5-(carboxyamino)imidazole ribonucleotide mutase [Myxococcota bacterium]
MEKGNSERILILMGSDSDWEAMKEATAVLDDFGVKARVHISSAHRTPERTAEIVKSAEENGIKVIIAGAGMAAHLAGVVAAHTTLPVIGVPLDASPLGGLDALLSTVQMPPGIPVATVAIGKPGAKNAAHLALQILALADSALAEKLKNYREKQKTLIEEKDKKLRGK